MPIAKLEPRESRDPLFAIVLSILVASILTVYPLSYEWAAWRPLWMMQIMLFWVMCQPTWCGVWFAFGMGIFVDLLMGSPLGMNALSFVIITFVARFITREWRVLSFFNLWIIAMIAVTAHLLMTWLMQILFSVDFSLTRHWLPLMVSIFCWPLVYAGLKKWRI